MKKVDSPHSIYSTDGKVEFTPIGPRPVLLVKIENPVSKEMIANIRKSMEHINEYLVLITDEDLTIKIIH